MTGVTPVGETRVGEDVLAGVEAEIVGTEGKKCVVA